jgi:GrpB-like predicted nucleotidyltransferase (UPF0157 family)
MSGAGSIRLVGGEEVIVRGDAEAVIRFYGDLFGKLTREVPGLDDLTRYVGFQRHIAGSDYAHFLGIEVGVLSGGLPIDSIPPGMVAWELTATEQIVWKRGETTPLRTAISWQWLDRPLSGRWTGEFRPATGGQPTWISANAYVQLDVADTASDEVTLVDANPAWAAQYQEMADWLRRRLDARVMLRIEHYGSTAIPGMPAKPIVDILVEVHSFEAAKRHVVPALNDPHWEYWWYSDHMVFVRRERPMGPRTHHLHLAPRGHRLWEGLAFRDYLRAHPEAAARYAALKRKLARSHREDREAYTQAKTAFVRQVTAEALAAN